MQCSSVCYKVRLYAMERPWRKKEGWSYNTTYLARGTRHAHPLIIILDRSVTSDDIDLWSGLFLCVFLSFVSMLAVTFFRQLVSKKKSKQRGEAKRRENKEDKREQKERKERKTEKGESKKNNGNRENHSSPNEGKKDKRSHEEREKREEKRAKRKNRGRKAKCFSCSSRQSEDWFHCRCTTVRLLRCSVIGSKTSRSFLQLAPESSEAKVWVTALTVVTATHTFTHWHTCHPGKKSRILAYL